MQKRAQQRDVGLSCDWASVAGSLPSALFSETVLKTSSLDPLHDDATAMVALFDVLEALLCVSRVAIDPDEMDGVIVDHLRKAQHAFGVLYKKVQAPYAFALGEDAPRLWPPHQLAGDRTHAPTPRAIGVCPSRPIQLRVWNHDGFDDPTIPRLAWLGRHGRDRGTPCDHKSRNASDRTRSVPARALYPHWGWLHQPNRREISCGWLCIAGDWRLAADHFGASVAFSWRWRCAVDCIVNVPVTTHQSRRWRLRHVCALHGCRWNAVNGRIIGVGFPCDCASKRFWYHGHCATFVPTRQILIVASRLLPSL